MVASAALNHRAVTGEGNYVDFSMAEALTASIPEALLDYQMNDRIPEPMGTADKHHAPHNVYRCKGDDRWLAIVVATDAEWQSLCETIGRQGLGGRPWTRRGARQTHVPERNRRRNHRVDASGTTTTKPCTSSRMPGISAAPYLSPQRVFTDPQLREGGFFSAHNRKRRQSARPARARLAIPRRPRSAYHRRVRARPA